MIAEALVARLVEAHRGIPRDVWSRLVAEVGGLGSRPDSVSIHRVTGGLINRDAAWVLSEAFLRSEGATWPEIGAAMLAVGLAAASAHAATEIIWTGPANERQPVRRVDQVLYDLVAQARTRLLLVTFAAHRIAHLCQHLASAVQRGVTLTLIVESEDESEGQLTSDAMNAFGAVPRHDIHLYYWPLAQRERNQAGRPGKLHAKCVVADDVALVGSANLTDDAFNRNMELGVLLREPQVVAGIVDHFEDLMRRGVLKRVEPAR